VADLGNGLRNVGERFLSPRAARRYTTNRLEKRAAMARQSWPEFWRDLGMRFLVAGAVVLFVLLVLWLVGLFVH
jgi:hypothetical protein